MTSSSEHVITNTQRKYTTPAVCGVCMPTTHTHLLVARALRLLHLGSEVLGEQTPEARLVLHLQLGHGAIPVAEVRACMFVHA
jgi:hypothetical protein